jgi:hypothetical protein
LIYNTTNNLNCSFILERKVLFPGETCAREQEQITVAMREEESECSRKVKLTSFDALIRVSLAEM